MAKLKLGILISGRGSNLTAVIKNCIKNTINAEVCVVISNKKEAKGLQSASNSNIPAIHISPKDYKSNNAYETDVINTLEAHNVNLVVLAGYMKLVGDPLLKRYANRMINIHPSLLPAFKGLDAQQQALDYGVKITGCTVHYVTKEMDAGPIILQTAVPVKDDDTIDTLSERILIEEHQLLSQAIQQISESQEPS